MQRWSNILTNLTNSANWECFLIPTIIYIDVAVPFFFQPEKCQTAPWKPSFSQRFGDVQRGEASETAVKNVAANTSDGMVWSQW